MTLPYLFASLAFSPPVSTIHSDGDLFASQINAKVEELHEQQNGSTGRRYNSVLLVCALTSGTLLLVGVYAKINPPKTVLDRRKSSVAGIYRLRRKIGIQKEISRVASNMAGVGLPFYASIQLGGAKVAVILLSTIASDLSKWFAGRGLDHDSESFITRLRARKFTVMVLLLGALLDFVGITSDGSKDTFLGYMALILSLFALPFPLSSSATGGPKEAAVTTPPRPWESVRGAFQSAPTTSSLIASPYDVNITIATAAILSMVAMVFSLLLGTYESMSYPGWVLSALSIISAAANVFISQPAPILLKRNLKIAFAFLFTSTLFTPQVSWLVYTSNFLFIILSLGAVIYESPTSKTKKHGHPHDNSTQRHKKHVREHSKLTAYLLTLCEPGSISYSVLIEKDSRRIAYFAM